MDIRSRRIIKTKMLCEKSVFPDFSKLFILITDTSEVIVGGILLQREINKDHPIAYASQTDNEVKYNIYEKSISILC